MMLYELVIKPIEFVEILDQKGKRRWLILLTVVISWILGHFVVLEIVFSFSLVGIVMEIMAILSGFPILFIGFLIWRLFLIPLVGIFAYTCDKRKEKKIINKGEKL